MKPVVERTVTHPEKPVHVLIIVVGEYIGLENFIGAGDFAEKINRFWRDRQRKFPRGQQLGSIRVLASDRYKSVAITDDADTPIPAKLPTWTNCKDALVAWCNDIALSNGVGILHWVSHGLEQLKGGDSVVLYCHGEEEELEGIQAGFDWTKILHNLNSRLKDHPVYCFIDACRSPYHGSVDYKGIATVDYETRENAVVFRSTQRTRRTYWVKMPENQAARAGCGTGPLGTQAFLAALEAFGARLDHPDGQDHPVMAEETRQASTGLVARWAKHQKIEQDGTTLGEYITDVPILMTRAPRSIVDVEELAGKACKQCHAVSQSGPVTLSETAEAPFEFRLARDYQSFVLDGTRRTGARLIDRPCLKI